jgi:hypothetical protein
VFLLLKGQNTYIIASSSGEREKLQVTYIILNNTYENVHRTARARRLPRPGSRGCRGGGDIEIGSRCLRNQYYQIISINISSLNYSYYIFLTL